MNLLPEEDKLLYDSCKTFAETYVNVKMAMNIPGIGNGNFSFKENACLGDANIYELCNRCPLYITLENYKVFTKASNSQD